LNSLRFKHCALLLALATPLAHAQDWFTKIEAEPKSELWIDSGFWTAHFDSGKGLNGNNKGLGAEYRFNGSTAAVAGRFYNSDREWSNYAGVIWQPYAVGPVRVGAYDYKRVGVNIGIIPTYKDRLYGGISLQLKLKVFE